MAYFPIETSEFFNEYKKTFGLAKMVTFFGKGQSTVYKWCADAKTNEETRNNPLDKLEEMIEHFVEAGQTETAQRLVDRLARKVGGELSFRNVEPDKDSFLEETIDVSVSAGNFSQLGLRLLKEKKGSWAQVRDAKKDALRQLDEAMVALKRECGARCA